MLAFGTVTRLVRVLSRETVSYCFTAYCFLERLFFSTAVDTKSVRMFTIRYLSMY